MSTAQTGAPQAPQGAGAMRMLAAFVRRYPGRSAAALGALFVASLFEGLGISMFLSMLAVVTDETGGTSGPQQIAMNALTKLGIDPAPASLIAAAAVMIALRGAMSLLANRQVGYTVAHIATDLRMVLIRATMQARWKHYLDQSVGGLSNSIATEAQRASETFQLGTEMAAMVLTSLVYLAVAFSIAPEAGIGAAVAGVVLLLALRILIRKSRRAGQRQTRLQKSLLTLIGAQFAAAKPLKAMAREDHVDALLTDETQLLQRALRKQVISKGALTALQEPIMVIMAMVGFFIGITTLDIPLGELMVMLFLLVRVVNYLGKGQKAYQQLVIHESAYWSVMAAIAAAQDAREPAGGNLPAEFRRHIELEAVHYSHDGRHKVLDGVSATLPARGLTVLVGPSGSGKTTLLDLVVGLREPDAGRVLVDGVPLAELQLREWRRQIGYVPQESVMVDESVAHNLTLGEKISEEKVREALRDADALQFVEAMPEGLATHVGHGGSRLSGGQRQRLAIARALIHDPKLLILDEATSNLDPEAQEAIVGTVGRLKQRMAVLAVAHTDKLVREADQIWRLSEGRLVQLDATPGVVALGG
ncbi:MAG: ABC transporter ATP-binding protein/permease [Pseudomonadota bacterium]|nr:ABC transporter ATP-binding protein/permease [Pseudomonadota bacterium]